MKLWGPLSVYHASPLTQPSPGENHLNSLHQGEDLLVGPVEVHLKVPLWNKMDGNFLNDWLRFTWMNWARVILPTSANLATHSCRHFIAEASMFSSVARIFSTRELVTLLALAFTYCLRGIHTSESVNCHSLRSFSQRYVLVSFVCIRVVILRQQRYIRYWKWWNPV